jgi:hypothetical protein
MVQSPTNSFFLSFVFEVMFEVYPPQDSSLYGGPTGSAELGAGDSLYRQIKQCRDIAIFLSLSSPFWIYCFLL